MVAETISTGRLMETGFVLAGVLGDRDVEGNGEGDAGEPSKAFPRRAVRRSSWAAEAAICFCSVSKIDFQSGEGADFDASESLIS